MKVLFVCSGKLNNRPGPVVANQADSIIKQGVAVDFYTIGKGGLMGYLKNIKGIRRTFLKGNYDIIHAHYSLSAFAASLAGRFPLVVSLMGSDAYLSGIMRLFARLFYIFSWNATIVKSEKMKELLKMQKAEVLPNGVDTHRFREIPQQEAKDRIGYNKKGKLIVFVADPSRQEKNFALAQEVYNLVGSNNLELLPVYNVPTELIPFYINAADVVLLTSKWEGSPNIIKEAMACNRPIVSTDVGDVSFNISGLPGCYVCSHSANELADAIKQVLAFSGSTNGRQRIAQLGYESDTIAKKIIEIYQTVVAKRK